MCGIFGVVGRRSTVGLRDAALTLRHRGPDAFGEWTAVEPPVYLAHCRLSIIDLSEAGKQPLGNEDGSIQIVYNGEIYNFAELRSELERCGHQFRSRTDTEVVVHAYEEWGAACVERFRGIFAFGLWDGRRRQLLLARDRLGVKPLFYAIRGEQLAFASEPRALLAIPGFSRSLDVPAAIQFLQYSYTTGPNTIWSGITRLAAANTLVFDAASATAMRSVYWTLPLPDCHWTLEDAVGRTDELLGEAVREELMGDVPVGVFLSGGVDSSLVTAYAAQSSPAIKSFCADFVGWDGSEVNDSCNVARHLRTSHEVCSIDRNSCNLADAETANAFFHTWDEPLGDPAILPTWQLSQLTRKHVTVALSGDGGDEMFAGYNWYAQVQPSPRRRASWFVESIRRQYGIGREWPLGCANVFEYYQFLHCPTFSRTELRTLFPDWGAEVDLAEPGRLFAEKLDDDAPDFRKWQLLDMQTYLVSNNLARVDRASMAHGLEVRVPLLDHRLVEFAFSLPDDLCHRKGTTKFVLRELMRRQLPPEVLQKRKQGFSFPLERFITQAEMTSVVRAGALASSGVLNAAAFERWLHVTEAGNLQVKLWLLFVLEQWACHWWLGRA